MWYMWLWNMCLHSNGEQAHLSEWLTALLSYRGIASGDSQWRFQLGGPSVPALSCHINASLEQWPCGLCALSWKAPNKQDRKGQDRTNGSHFTLPWFLFGYKHIQLVLKWKKLRWLNLNLPLLCARNTTFSP